MEYLQLVDLAKSFVWIRKYFVVLKKIGWIQPKKTGGSGGSTPDF